MKNSSKILTIVIVLTLFIFLWRGLFHTSANLTNPNTSSSILLGETVPAFSITTFSGANETFSQKDLLGKVSLLNFWATWCYACRVEMPMLMKIKNEYGIPIYSIAYKDKASDVQQWLQEHGNPFVVVGNDVDGNVAIDLGIYGTPETFVISPEGKIVYRYVGVIDEEAWRDVLYPVVKQYARML